MLSLIIGAFVIAVGAILIKNKIASGPIDLNSAPASKLESLPGIGPETARAIVKGRPYETIEELDKVRGIGPATIEKLRDWVTAGD
ncbi:MAG: helix-hairpin-helix domain-containing protein [Verrucomicrobiae bacterium]|nr:helix-hairpin-helix domain-containing protein [Verrucomicrobiae bacterium]